MPGSGSCHEAVAICYYFHLECTKVASSGDPVAGDPSSWHNSWASRHGQALRPGMHKVGEQSYSTLNLMTKEIPVFDNKY